MTQHDIYDEYKGLRIWNYLTCEKDAQERETWHIRVEVKRIDEVVVPAVAGNRTYVDRGLAQVAGRELGARLIDESGIA